VTTLRPRIGIENEQAREGRARQRLDERAGVAGPQSDVFELFALDCRKRFRDAIDEGLGADQSDVAIGARLCDEMLAAAEADLDPDLARRKREQRAAFDRGFCPDFKLRQPALDERRMVTSKRLAMRASIERTPPALRQAGALCTFLSVWRNQEAKRLKSSARSIFSQEKPPSASGLRPKWP
jgi:hypothetical protein